MPSKQRIKVGSRVSSKVGPLKDPPATSKGGGGKRKVRSVYHGTVLSSEPNRLWLVHWDECDKTCLHLVSQLTLLSNACTDDVDKDLMKKLAMNKKMRIGTHKDMLSYTKDLVSNSQP